jgi:hypothetical protein
LRVALLLIVLLAFGLRLHELARQDIWWDEARNLDVALRPLADIATSPELDIQPPLYYYLLHGWMAPAGLQVGADPERLAWWARWLSVAAGTVLPLLVAALAAKGVVQGMAPRRAVAAVSAALVGALSPFWLAESQETRMYTVGLALLAAAAWALLAAELPAQAGGPRQRTGSLIAFTLLSTAALATHYNAVFVLATWYVWWGVRSLFAPDRWRRLLAPLGAGVATVLMLLPLAPIAVRQIPTYANPNLTVPSVSAYLVANVQGHLAGYAWDAARIAGWAPWWLWSVLVLSAIGLILGVGASRGHHAAAQSAHGRPQEWHVQIFLLVWLIGGLSLYYIAVLDRGAFNVRYSAFVTPALVALIGAGVAGWGRFWPAPLLVIVAGMAPFVHADLYDSRFDREDMAGVARWLREQTRPGDLVLVDQRYPLGFYYQRYEDDTRFEPVGPEAAPARYLFVDVNSLDERLNQWAADAERLFWVQWFESDTDPRHAVPYLLGQAGRPAGEESFQGWRINWWELSPPNRFATAPNLQPLRITIPPVETVEVSLPTTATVGEALPVAIRWQRAAGDPGPFGARPLKARVALYDEAENRLLQADERLINDRHVAPAEWDPADRPLNLYLLAPEPAAPVPPGRYTLRLLVYDADTLEPLTLLDAAGNPAGIEQTLGFVDIE